MIGLVSCLYYFVFKSWRMKPVFRIMAFALLILSIFLYFPVMQDGNYPYDQHGYYTSADGVLHRESESEKNFFRFLLSVALLIVTAFFGFKKSPARIQLK